MTISEQLEIISSFRSGMGVERKYKGIDGAWDSWDLIQDYNHSFDFRTYDYRIRVEPPSEESAMDAAWDAWSATVFSARVHGHGYTEFKAGWKAAKEYFTKP